jgi:hypothetical protein
MNDLDTETTLCLDCAIPIARPKPVPFSPFLAFQPPALCKDCVQKHEMVERIAHFAHTHCRRCPYQLPKWRPTR